MLEPSDTWKWYYNSKSEGLMLDLGMDMVFCVNLPKKMLVDSAFQENTFSIDDASAFHLFKEQVSYLPISEPRQAELTLNCVAARRFLKPIQPKSWFFSHQGAGYEPMEAEVLCLQNDIGTGHFIVLEKGETASMCMLVDLEPFALNPTKYMTFCEPIKVMHDRMAKMELTDSSYYALVG